VTHNNVVVTVPMPAGKGFNVYAIVASIALALLLSCVGEAFPSIQQDLRSAGYAGTFVLGMLYVYSFTPLSAAAMLFLIGRSQHLWLTGTISEPRQPSGVVARNVSGLPATF
jgi:hypothetical protein